MMVNYYHCDYRDCFVGFMGILKAKVCANTEVQHFKFFKQQSYRKQMCAYNQLPDKY